jgi:hypothetical protein
MILAELVVMSAMLISGCRSSAPQAVSPSTSRVPSAKVDHVASSGATPTGEKPALSAQIQSVSMYPVPNRREDLAVSLVVSVKNSGVASIANRWNLEVVASDPSIPSGVEPVHVTGVVDLPGTVNKKVDLGKEDLMVKTADSPISNGRMIEGVLTFVLPKTSENELVTNNTNFILHFRDSTGSAYQTPKIVVGRKKSELATKK